MNKYALIVFDLDGTLLDTAGEVTDAINDAFNEVGLPAITLEQTRSWVGKGAPDFLQKALAFCNVQLATQQEFDQLLAIFYHHYEKRSGTNSQIFPHVAEALKELHQSGYKLALLTNKFLVGTELVLKAHQLHHLFDDILAGDSFPEKKPDPVGIHFLMDKYNFTAEEILYIGDSSTDVQTARNAGVEVWVVPYGYNHGDDIREAKPDRIIHNLSCLS